MVIPHIYLLRERYDLHVSYILHKTIWPVNTSSHRGTIIIEVIPTTRHLGFAVP